MNKIIIFIAVFACLGAYASTSKLEHLNSSFDLITYSSESSGALSVLASAVQEFISKKSNSNILKSSEGKALLKKQRKLLNYLAIKKSFDDCVKKSSRNLDNRILQAAGNFENIEEDCKESIFKYSSLDDFVNEVNLIKKQTNLATLKSKIYVRSIKNAASTYLNIKYKFTSEATSESMVLDLCKQKNSCDKETQNILLQHGRKYLAALKRSKSPRISAEKSVGEINSRVDELNNYLSKVDIDVDKGWFNNFAWDSSDPKFTKESREEFDRYTEKYITAASSDSGILMLTDHMKKKIGGLRRLEEDVRENSDSRKNLTTYSYSPHEKINEEDVKLATLEIEGKIKDQVKLLSKLSKNKASGKNIKANDKDLMRLIKTNPAAVGQALINNPRLSKSVCEVINEIQSSDESDEKWDKVFMWGGVVVGGALLLTGVGAAGGAWILAGTASAATLATVGTTAAAAGLVVGLADSGYYATKAIKAKRSQQEFEAAFITGNGDAESIREASAALTEFNEAKVTAALSLGFSALDVGALTGVIKAAKFGRVLKEGASAKKDIGSLKRASKTLNTILKDEKLVAQFSKAKKVLGGEKLSKFIGYLSQGSEELRRKILNKLKNAKDTKFQRMINEAIVIAESCVG